MKKVIISIKGIQKLDGGDDGVELVTDGEYSVDGSKISFSYMESELTGLEGTYTTFSIDEGVVTLLRQGAVNTQMQFHEGKKHYFAYETPYGTFTMGVDTLSVYSSLGENGGDLEIYYMLDMENSVVSRNIFKINVKEA